MFKQKHGDKRVYFSRQKLWLIDPIIEIELNSTLYRRTFKRSNANYINPWLRIQGFPGVLITSNVLLGSLFELGVVLFAIIKSSLHRQKLFRIKSACRVYSKVVAYKAYGMNNIYPRHGDGVAS